jgi:hypothetical protein
MNREGVLHPAHVTVSRSFIAFAPFGVGVVCALFYFEHGNDIYGWWIGARDSEYRSAYFKLEDYFSTQPTRFYGTEESDLYGGWRFLYSENRRALDKPVHVNDAVAHELDRRQGVFVSEWLFFEDAPQKSAERMAYEKMKFPVRHVNVRAAGIARLDRHEPLWVYRSHDFNQHVLEYLERYWPLDYGTDGVRTSRAARPLHRPSLESTKA